LATTDRPGRGVYTRQNFLSIYLPSIALAMGTGIVVPALPVYARSFGVSFEVASLVIIVQQLGHTIVAYPTGLLMDRFGRRKVVLAGPILMALSSFLAAMAGSFPELLIYRFIGGIGEQMWRVGRLTMIADTGADRERGRQITTMSAMESSGRLFAPMIGAFIALFWDIRAPFIAHGVLCLIAIIPSFLLIRETAPHLIKVGANGRPAPTKAPDAGMRALLVFPIVIFFTAQFFASFARGPIFTGQLNFYGTYAYDLGPQNIAMLATITTAVAIPMSLASGYIMDHFGRKATLVPGLTLLTVAFGFLGLTAIFHMPFEAFMIAYLAVYACTAMTGGNMQTLGSDIAPASARGRFYGVSHMIGNIGGPLATAAFAALSAGFGYWSAFAFLGFTAGAAALILGTQVRDRVRAERKAEEGAVVAASSSGGVVAPPAGAVEELAGTSNRSST